VVLNFIGLGVRFVTPLSLAYLGNSTELSIFLLLFALLPALPSLSNLELHTFVNRWYRQHNAVNSSILIALNAKYLLPRVSLSILIFYLLCNQVFQPSLYIYFIVLIVSVLDLLILEISRIKTIDGFYIFASMIGCFRVAIPSIMVLLLHFLYGLDDLINMLFISSVISSLSIFSVLLVYEKISLNLLIYGLSKFRFKHFFTLVFRVRIYLSLSFMTLIFPYLERTALIKIFGDMSTTILLYLTLFTVVPIFLTNYFIIPNQRLLASKDQEFKKVNILIKSALVTSLILISAYLLVFRNYFPIIFPNLNKTDFVIETLILCYLSLQACSMLPQMGLYGKKYDKIIFNINLFEFICKLICLLLCLSYSIAFYYSILVFITLCTMLAKWWYYEKVCV